MTNPNNAIGTNGAFNGRTSPNALNDLAAAFTRGIVSGWNCVPKSGMTVQLGGSASVRDVALAEDNAGDKLTINNRSGAPVEITLDGAPATNNRIDAIVAYVDNPSTGDGNTTDNPTACGIIAVSGTVAANPTAPTDEQIRSAITTDGATGGVAYYVVLATIRVGTNVTTIGAGVITQGAPAQSIAALADGAVSTDQIADEAVTTEKIDWSSVGQTATCTYATNYETHTNDQALMLYKIGKLVVLTGAAQNKIKRDFGDYWYEEVVATIPEGFRPAQNIGGAAMKGSGAYIYRQFAKSTGEIGYTQMNQGTGTSGMSNVGARSFFPFMMSWFTA